MPTRNPAEGVVILLVRSDAYLLQHRDNRPDIVEPDSYSVWGGAIEPTDSSPQAAAIRELQEETGINIAVERLIDLGEHQEQMTAPALGPRTAILHHFAVEVPDDFAFEVREGQGLAIITRPYRKNTKVNRMTERVISRYEAR